MKKKAIRFHPLNQSHTWQPHPLLMPLDPLSLPEVNPSEFALSWQAIWDMIQREEPLTKAELQTVVLHHQNRVIRQTLEDSATTRLLLALKMRHPHDADLRRNIQMRAYALLHLMGQHDALGELSWEEDGTHHYDPKLILTAALLPLDAKGHLDIEQAVRIVQLSNEQMAKEQDDENDESDASAPEQDGE